MSDTSPFSNNHEWLQYYQETTTSTPLPPPVPVSDQLFDDASVMMAGFAADNVSSLDNNPSPTAGGKYSNTSPRGGGTLKPIRRRSRASKKTPVTLLNTSATNFRALVQQFTGCPSTMAATASSFGRRKGPVNLNFERNDQLITETSRYPNYYNQEQTPNLQQQTQGSFGSSISESTRANLDDFGMENIPLQNEFIDESQVNETNTNGDYFF